MEASILMCVSNTVEESHQYSRIRMNRSTNQLEFSGDTPYMFDRYGHMQERYNKVILCFVFDQEAVINDTCVYSYTNNTNEQINIISKLNRITPTGDRYLSNGMVVPYEKAASLKPIMQLSDRVNDTEVVAYGKMSDKNIYHFIHEYNKQNLLTHLKISGNEVFN